jgi:hypothetical protein
MGFNMYNFTLKNTAVFMLIMLGLQPALNAAEMAEDSGAWIQSVAEGSLGGIDPSLQKSRVWLETQSRFDGDWSHWYQGMLRTAVGYSLTDRATIWAGYTFLPTQNLTHNSAGEATGNGVYRGQQDIWPAFRYNMPTDFGTLSFRSMWESNFVANEVRERPRQMIKFMHPLAFEKRLSFIVWDEVFYRVNKTNWGGKAGFDQNRAFAGLGWTFNPNLRTELGYMNQYLDMVKVNGTENLTMHHLAMASLFISF